MPCSSSLKGWVGVGGGIVFNKNKSPTKIKMEVPCGQCWSCRLARSREWATRLIKEATNWPEEQRTFITLTYNNENLPEDGSLHVEDFQNFMKALRYHFSILKSDGTRRNPKLKYFHCGEYGETCKTCNTSYIMHKESKSGKKYTGCNNFIKGLGRPHYHAILFGVTFEDMEEFKRTKSGELIYKSNTLDKIWDKGYCSIGQVTFESCAYVARYIMKKVTGEQSEQHYQKPTGIDTETGEVITTPVKPEYITMSRNPAIAKEWANKYLTDIAKNDSVLLERKGKAFETQPPRYFLKLLEKEDPIKYELLKSQRRIKKAQNKSDNTDERSLIKERLKQIQTKNLTRNFEDYENEN